MPSTRLLWPISESKHRFMALRLSPFELPYSFATKWFKFFLCSNFKYGDFLAPIRLLWPFSGSKIVWGLHYYHHSIRRKILPQDDSLTFFFQKWFHGNLFFAGLHFLVPSIPVSTPVPMVIIWTITFCATISVVSGTVT